MNAACACAGAASEAVVVLAPTGQDAPLIAAALQGADVPCRTVAGMVDVVRAVACGAAALIIAEEVLDGTGTARLADALARQETWSDIPVLMLRTPRASGGVSTLYERLGNLTLIERPTSVATLLSIVGAARRARARQHQVRAMDQRKDEYLAMLSHELRNPLAPLVNAHRLLERSTSLSAADRRALGLARRQADQLTRLVDDLLEIARVTQGKIVLARRATDLGEAIAHAVESVAALYEARDQSIDVIAAPGLVVDADPARLAQILENLLTNASKYSADGTRVRVECEPQADRAVVRVVDEGIGIDPDRIADVFGWFTQLDTTLHRSDGGLGVGLALVKRLAELHGGSVSAASQGKGTGSTFVVSLPRMGTAAVLGGTGSGVAWRPHA